MNNYDFQEDVKDINRALSIGATVTILTIIGAITVLRLMWLGLKAIF